LPAELVQQLHLPRYDKLPATLFGRFARSKLFKGRGLGKLLLIGAMKRALDHSMNIASVAVVVDAIDENARSLPAVWLYRYSESPQSALHAYEHGDADSFWHRQS
jgi:hypothetical protein